MEIVDTSGFPVESIRTKDDFPTLGAPTRQSVGASRSTTGIARRVCKYKWLKQTGFQKGGKKHHDSTNQSCINQPNKGSKMHS